MEPVQSDDRDEFRFIFRGPKENNPSQPVVDLPGVIAITPSGRTQFLSMWRPSKAEIDALIAGHNIVIGILNDGKPIFPFFVGVTKQPTTLLEYPDES